MQVDPNYIDGTSADALIEAERAHIELARRERSGVAANANLPWAGIALSGGGIRAATFSLGALQALAANDLLKRFDYISSVSGGGYIATSLQWWWSKARYDDDPIIAKGNKIKFGMGPKDFPYGTGRPGVLNNTDSDEQAQNLAYLRSHGYYLAPGDGINVWSALAVVLRTILLSLLFWIPLLVLVFVALQYFDEYILQALGRDVAIWMNKDLQSLQSPFGSIIAYQWSCGALNVDPTKCAFGMRLFYAVILWGYLAAIAIFVLISIAYALVSRAGQNMSGGWARLGNDISAAVSALLLMGWSVDAYFQYRPMDPTIAVGIVLAITGSLALVGYIFADVFRHRAINGSYFLRRTLERGFGLFFVPTLTLLIIGLVPVIPYLIMPSVIAAFGSETNPGGIATGILGAFSVLSGALSALYGYYTMVQKIIPGLAGRILAPTGAAIFLYGTLLFGYVVGVIAFLAIAQPDSITFPGVRNAEAVVWYIEIVVGITALIGLVLGWVASVNQIGLHRFYRDRLMETFMPASAAIIRGRADYSAVADRLQLSDLVSTVVDKKAAQPNSQGSVLFPLINTLVTITSDPDLQLVSRGGDNFVLSPLFVGSRSTGWLRTTRYIDLFGPLTLASAMAASGAAINSNAGYLGTGATRSRLVSMVMTILNMRLGLWIGNPARRNRWGRVANYFRPMLTAGLLGLGRSKGASFLELSDGGNFDNLGIYELIRRRLSLIVVIDAEADSAIALPALVSAAHRVQQDFGAVISFFGLQDKGPERMVPVPVSGTATYPGGVGYADAPYLVGQIEYPAKDKNTDKDVGTLIYIKATLIKSWAFTTAGYRAGHADFPHQTTVDQFFNPDQFEAYRDLGYCSTELMIKALELTTSIGAPADILAMYSKCDRASAAEDT